MMTAKQKFMKLQYDLSTVREESDMEIQSKMQFIQEHDVSFAIWWTLFWCLFLVTFIIWIIAIMINVFNYNSRKKWRQAQYDRLWYKLQTLRTAPVQGTQQNNNPVPPTTPTIITPTPAKPVPVVETKNNDVKDKNNKEEKNTDTKK